MMRNIPSSTSSTWPWSSSGPPRSPSTTRRHPSRSPYLAGHCKAKLAVVEDDGLRRALRRGARTSCPRCGQSLDLSDAGRRPRPSSRTTPLDLAAEAGHCQPRHAGHRDLHVGHDRSAQGRDARPPQRRCGRPRRCLRLLGERAGRVPRRLLPADGPHRRADVHPLPRVPRRLRGHHLPEPRRRSPPTPRGPPPDHVRRAPGVGEDLRRRAGRPGRRPGAQAEVRRGGGRGHPDRRAAHGGRGHRGGRSHLGLPRRGRLLRRAPAARARRGGVRGHAAPPRSPPS